MGTAYLAGTTRGKAEFIAEDVARLRQFLASDIAMVIDHIHVASNHTAIVEMRSIAKLRSGAPYNMTYVWVVGFSKIHRKIEWVRAYVDNEVLNRVFRDNERLPHVFVTCPIEPSAGNWDSVCDILRNLKSHSVVAEAGLEHFHVLTDLPCAHGQGIEHKQPDRRIRQRVRRCQVSGLRLPGGCTGAPSPTHGQAVDHVAS